MFWLIAIAFATGLFLGSRSSKPDDGVLTQQLARNNRQWISFIRGHLKIAKGKEQKEAISRMLTDLEKQGYDVKNVEDAKVVSTNAQSTSRTTSQITPQSESQPIDNALLLLYVGAFLFLAAAGLFVIFSGVSGGMKFSVVLLCLALYYAAGLTLFNKSLRLRPAATGFLGIAMALVPLLGFTAYYYLFDQENGAAVWSATSILALGLYFNVLQITRSSLVTYLFIASALSLFESSVSLFNLPVYYFGWVMALCAVVAQILAVKGYMKPLMPEPLQLVSMLLMPASVLLGFGLIDQQGLVQFAVSLVLSASYYTLAALSEPVLDRRAPYALAANGSMLAALITFGLDMTDTDRVMSTVCNVLALAQLGFFLSASKQRILSPHTREYLAVLTAITPLTALFFGLGDAFYISISVVVFGLVSAVLFASEKAAPYLLLSVLSWLVLPLIVGKQLLDPSLSDEAFSVVYACMAVGHYFAKELIKPKSIEEVQIWRVGYGVSLVAVFLFAIIVGPMFAAVVSLLLTGVVALLAIKEKVPELTLISAGLVYIAEVLLLKDAEKLTYITLPTALAASGLVMFLMKYFFGGIYFDFVRKMGFVGMGVAASSVLFFEKTSWPMILSAAVFGACLIAENYRKKMHDLVDLGATIVIVALSWALYTLDFTSILLYSHIWAAFLGAMAYRRYLLKMPETEKSYTVAALLVFSIFLAYKALASEESSYGIILIIEHAGLVTFGAAIKRKFISQWAAAVTVLAVLYQLRELRFVVLGLLSLTIIGVAVYMLSKNNRHE